MERKRRKVHIVGIGTGVHDLLTINAESVLKKADVIIGAKRMIEFPFLEEKQKFQSYSSEKIVKYLDEHEEYNNACILVSGDVGFYSAAKKLLLVLKAYDVELVPGISSLLYFCAKIKLPWDEMDIISMHGRKCNFISHVIRKKTTFAILSGSEELYDLCKKIEKYNLENITIHIGENLSYPDEKIIHIQPSEVKKYEYGKLLVVVVENSMPDTRSYFEIADDDFIRGKVPMTKSEVRTVCIGKLNLDNQSVLYDIGAGTGSISIQAALNNPESQVIAIERKKDAVDLINENIKHFAADNITVIEGIAPECLHNLIKPTHVFIGGSAGNLKEILKCVWEKNPCVRVVVTAVTLETVAEVTNILKENNIADAEIVQMNIAKSQKISSFHLMFGQNPVTIFTFQKSIKA